MNTNDLKQEIIKSLRDCQLNMQYLTCSEVKPGIGSRMQAVNAAKKRFIPFCRKISKIEISTSYEI